MPKISTRTSGKEEKIVLKKKSDKKEVAAPAVKKSKIITPDSEPIEFDLRDVYAANFDEMEKQYNLTSGSIDIPDKLSTELLMLDTICGGGIGSFMTMFSGLEGGGKTSAALTILGSALRKNIPSLSYYDAENAVSDSRYASILMGYDADHVFSSESRMARKYSESNLEKFFNSSRFTMSKVPDKIYRADKKDASTGNSGWYYVFDTTKEGRSLMARFGYKEKSYDTDLYRLTGRLWCPTDRKGLQGILFVDSLAALVTSAIEEKDTGGGRAVTARALSENFVKVMGMLKEKNFALIFTQQLREKPEASYGNSGPIYYEPSGNSAKFNASLRCRFLPRAVPSKDGWAKGVGASGYETSEWGAEKSWYSSTDTDKYKYVLIKNVKNKLGVPSLENFMRVCHAQGNGIPGGIDKTFDTYEFLRRTGRIEKVKEKGKKQAFKVHMDEVRGKVFDLFEFKGFITAIQDPKMKRVITDSLGGDKIPDIRKTLFKDIRNKKCYEMMQKKAKESNDDDEVDLEA